MVTPCPVCGRQPDIDKCSPWPPGLGKPPWYVGCYRGCSNEHFVGVNGDDRDDAIKQWEDHVKMRAALVQIAESHLPDCPASMDETAQAKEHIMRLRKLAADALK